MISLKTEGIRARIGGVKTEMFFVLMVIDALFAHHKFDCVITSGTEPSPKRKKGSKHLIGQALDFRTRGLTLKDQKKVVAALKKALGPDYYVKLESDHLHVGYDPEPIGE